MTKGTQLWPNERMRDFFLAHIRRETSLTDNDAARLTEALLKAVNRMLVWETPEEAGPVTSPAPSVAKGKAGAAKSKTAAAPPKPLAGPASPAQPLPSSGGPVSGGANSGSATFSAARKPAFDPYSFSATVVLAKTGRDGLMKRLSEIKSADQLKAFAEAQHLGLDRKLSKPEDLRKALLIAAEQRLADRKAAAS